MKYILEHMQNIPSIESCKSSKEKTEIQAFREGKLYWNSKEGASAKNIQTVPKKRRTKVENTKRKTWN